MSDFSKEIELFNGSIAEIDNLLFVTRDSELQRNAIDDLSALSGKIRTWKGKAIADKDENGANLFLGCECVVEALQAELSMWLKLKETRPDDAWNDLVLAQQAIGCAIRAHKAFSNLVDQSVRLLNIERLIFPSQVFLSAGLIVGSQMCSICGAEYGDCSHLLGMPYMGVICRCILRDIHADHVAIVSEPANKQCRVTHFNVEGGKRNRMTWRIEKGEIGRDEHRLRDGLSATGIILAASDLGASRSEK